MTAAAAPAPAAASGPRAALDRRESELRARFEAGAPAGEIVTGRAEAVDGALRAAWSSLGVQGGGDAALVAVGGYGRGELHPGSDVDLLVLVGAERAAALDRRGSDPRIESFVARAWDLGLELGHAVRSVRQCAVEARRDLTVITNLIEARRLAGSRALFDEMRGAVSPARMWPPGEFFRGKEEEQRGRHLRHRDSGYRLEPNVKEGPGGLRDVQTVAWIARRYFGPGGDDARPGLRDLFAHGFLTEDEYRSLREDRDFLWRVRTALHHLAGRREDRLLFDRQIAVAEHFGYRDADHNLGVERFMKRYYRTVQSVSRLNELLLQVFRERFLGEADAGGGGRGGRGTAGAPSSAADGRGTVLPPAGGRRKVRNGGGRAGEAGKPEPGDAGNAVRRINRRFQVRGGRIEAKDPEVFRRHPFALLELFLLLQQHPEIEGVRASTIRLIRRHLHLVDEEFRGDLACRSLFLEILREPQGLAHALRRMHAYGILGRYLPEFGRIVGLMQFDLFHVYTVDEHLLRTVSYLRRFGRADHRHELPHCSDVFDTLPKPELLHLAGLFHDVAKGRGSDHSEDGAREAAAFCERHGISRYDADLVRWLVRHHLIMSMTAQREDVSDPATVRRFADLAGDAVRLDYLYLLTVADVRATNPDLWTDWKDALLRDFYQATRRMLVHAGVDARPPAAAELARGCRDEARRRLAESGPATSRLEDLWETLEPDYFVLTAPEAVAWHAAEVLGAPAGRGPAAAAAGPDEAAAAAGSEAGDDARRAAPALPVVALRTRRKRTEVFFHVADRDHLFAAAATLLERAGVTVVDARVFTTATGMSFDSFTIAEPGGGPIDDPRRQEEIRRALARGLKEPEKAVYPTNRLPRRQVESFRTPTRVTFDERPADGRTVMEVICGDRPGVLSRIGWALAGTGVSVHGAKIATYGERAEDVFRLTNRDGRPLNAGEQAALRAHVLRALGPREAGQPPVTGGKKATSSPSATR